MKTQKIKIERGVLLEAESLAQFSRGGTHPGYKTKKANQRYIKEVFGSNEKSNWMGEYLLTEN